MVAIGCGSEGKGNGEPCAENADCSSDYCEPQSDGTKICATRPTQSSSGSGGW